MCMGRQPEAPINKPNYAPSEAHQHFEYSKTPQEQTRREPEQPQPSAKPKTVATTSKSIRM